MGWRACGPALAKACRQARPECRCGAWQAGVAVAKRDTRPGGQRMGMRPPHAPVCLRCPATPQAGGCVGRGTGQVDRARQGKPGPCVRQPSKTQLSACQLRARQSPPHNTPPAHPATLGTPAPPPTRHCQHTRTAPPPPAQVPFRHRSNPVFEETVELVVPGAVAQQRGAQVEVEVWVEHYLRKASFKVGRGVLVLVSLLFQSEAECRGVERLGPMSGRRRLWHT